MIQHSRTKVVVAQGHCLLRDALIDRLRRETWIEVCAVASNVEDIAPQIELYNPQILLMNIALKCSAGLSCIKKLKRDHSGVSIVAISCDSEFEDTYIGQALRAGADGYVSAEDSLDDLIHAVRMVERGKPYLTELTRNKLSLRVAENSRLVNLSVRESEVFFLTGCGYAPQRIAEKMKLSVKTIESYRERIRKKMDLSTGADLQFAATNFMRCAARRGFNGVDHEVVKEMLSATG